MKLALTAYFTLFAIAYVYLRGWLAGWLAATDVYADPEPR